MRSIITCAGLGDFIWLAMKLLNTPEQFNIIMPAGLPQRGHQVKDILPKLVGRHEYMERHHDRKLGYKTIARHNIQRFGNRWKKIKDEEFYLSANEWLEQGNRIEGFLLDLPTTFYPDYATSQADKETAMKLIKDGPVHIGIYTSAYSNARHWRGWIEKEWIEFIKLVHKEDKDIVFVFIGAPYDLDLNKLIMDELQGVRFVNTVGQPLTTVMEIMKRLNYFLGFPSGLSILCSTLGKPNTMFYPVHLTKLMNTWADPKMIQSGDYKGCLFCRPQQIYRWLVKDYSLFDKMYA